MKLGNLTRNQRSCVIDFYGEELSITYRPGVYTPRNEEEMKDNPTVKAMVGFLTKLLVSWDLTGDNEELIPITENSLYDIPSPLLLKILSGVWDDVSSGEAKGLSVVS